MSDISAQGAQEASQEASQEVVQEVAQEPQVILDAQESAQEAQEPPPPEATPGFSAEAAREPAQEAQEPPPPPPPRLVHLSIKELEQLVVRAGMRLEGCIEKEDLRHLAKQAKEALEVHEAKQVQEGDAAPADALPSDDDEDPMDVPIAEEVANADQKSKAEEPGISDSAEEEDSEEEEVRRRRRHSFHAPMNGTAEHVSLDTDAAMANQRRGSPARSSPRSRKALDWCKSGAHEWVVIDSCSWPDRGPYSGGEKAFHGCKHCGICKQVWLEKGEEISERERAKEAAWEALLNEERGARMRAEEDVLAADRNFREAIARAMVAVRDMDRLSAHAASLGRRLSHLESSLRAAVSRAEAAEQELAALRSRRRCFPSGCWAWLALAGRRHRHEPEVSAVDEQIETTHASEVSAVGAQIETHA